MVFLMFSQVSEVRAPSSLFATVVAFSLWKPCRGSRTSYCPYGVGTQLTRGYREQQHHLVVLGLGLGTRKPRVASVLSHLSMLPTLTVRGKKENVISRRLFYYA